MRKFVDPRYDCSRCGPLVNPEYDAEHVGECEGCPFAREREFLFTGWREFGANNYRGDYAGLFSVWGLKFGEFGSEPKGEQEDELARTLGRVLDAVGPLPDGAVDPAWTLEFGALVDAWRSALSRVRREIEYAAEKASRAAPHPGGSTFPPGM